MSSHSLELEGPRILRPEEALVSHRLSHLCFGDLDELDLNAEMLDLDEWSHHGAVYVMAHQDKLVSQISIFHHAIQLPDGCIRLGSIGGVCTHPDYRGHGLASSVLDHCTRQLVQEGANLMLISGGRGLYTRLGCVPAGKFISFDILPGKFHPAVENVFLRPASSDDADLCSQLYQAEAVHFERTGDIFAEHLGRQGNYIHANQWLVDAAGQTMAYLFLGIPWEDMGQPEAGARIVMEYAGSRTALAAAAALILSQPGMRILVWPAPWQDQELIELLQGMGCRGVSMPLHDHTMRIINFPGLMTDLQPYQHRRLDALDWNDLRFEQTGPLLSASGDDRYIIARGHDRLELNGAEMTGLVMGGLDEAHVAPKIASSGLKNLISALYPLASFSPGLNYH